MEYQWVNGYDFYVELPLYFLLEAPSEVLSIHTLTGGAYTQISWYSKEASQSSRRPSLEVVYVTCHSAASCVHGACVCDEGFVGDGFSCTRSFPSLLLPNFHLLSAPHSFLIFDCFSFFLLALFFLFFYSLLLCPPPLPFDSNSVPSGFRRKCLMA